MLTDKAKQPDTPVDGSERPDMAIATQIAEYFRDEIKQLEERLGARISEAVNANAATVKRMNELEGALQELRSGLESTRIARADKELREAEARYKIALEQKDSLSTQEKIQVGQVVEDRLAAAARIRTERWRAFWDKVLPSVTTGLIMIIVGPVALAFFIAILVFVLRALGVAVQFPP